MFKDRLNLLRNKMIENDIDLYYFNTSDYHMSEYVSEYFKTIAYFSGFTGSLATLLVSLDDTFIFVDGRYHTQADKECLINDINVIKLGTKDALEPLDFILKNYKDKVIGFDGRRTNIKFGKYLLKHNIKFKSLDIYSDLIEDRVPLKNGEIYELNIENVGLSRKDKLNIIKNSLKGKTHIVNNLESIAYLLNLRSDDIKYTPVFLSNLVIMDDDFYLFVDIGRISPEVIYNLYEDEIIVRPYNSYYDFLKNIKGKKIIIDETKINFETYLNIKDKNEIYNMRSIIEDMKSIKNPVEQNNMRLAHIYDGVAVLRFLMWIDSIDKREVNEYEVAEKIDNFKKDYKAYDLSFSSIVAYNENAAIMHYFASKDNCSRLDNKGILLFDTGGQYKEGTTDITRTIALGEVSEEIKKYFTLVLKSMFNLSELKFLKGLSGNQIDVLARKDLWEIGVDYRCGTGHGVGFNLAVHEGPPNIRYGSTESKNELAEIKPGMIFSDEPGVYFENKFGIRCENLLLCIKDEENEYGQFLKFETLTMVPFDINLIDKNYLDDKTIKILNDYHQKVCDTLLPYLNEEEASFLYKITRPI